MSELLKGYTVDRHRRFSKELPGGYIAHPVTFEEQNMVPDTDVYLKKRQANQRRVQTNRFQLPSPSVWKDKALPYKTKRGVAVSITQRGNPR